MISATFIFREREFDEDFHQLDAKISFIAKNTSGYIGEETWSTPETRAICTVYYWETREGLRELMESAEHMKAKAASTRWLAGYQVVVSEVLACYGTPDFDHLLNKRSFDNCGLRCKHAG